MADEDKKTAAEREADRDARREAAHIASLPDWRQRLETNNAWRNLTEGLDAEWSDNGLIVAKVSTSRAQRLYTVGKTLLEPDWTVYGTYQGRLVFNVAQ